MKNTASVLDEKAKGFAKDFLRSEAALLSVLIEMRRQWIFAVLNYSGIFDYCERALKLSRAQSYYFKSVAEKSEEIPQIKEAITHGSLTLSQARRIVPVITKENQEEWINKARLLPQRELEREVAAVNPNAQIKERIKPVAKELSEMKVAVNAKTEENLEALKEILSQKLGKAVTLAEVVAWAAEFTREKHDPVKRAERAQTTLSRKRKATLKPGRQPISARIGHAIALREGQQCAYISADGRRCLQRRWLERHHLQAVRDGGLNTPENLRTLCHAHHRLVHLG